MEAKDIKAGDKFERLGIGKRFVVEFMEGEPDGMSRCRVLEWEGNSEKVGTVVDCGTIAHSGSWHRLPSSPPQVRPGQVWRMAGGQEVRVTKDYGSAGRGRHAIRYESERLDNGEEWVHTAGAFESMTLVSDAPEEAKEWPKLKIDGAWFKPMHNFKVSDFGPSPTAYQGSNLSREADIAAKMQAHNDAFQERHKEAIAAGLRADWTPSYGGNPSVRRYNQRGGR